MSSRTPSTLWKRKTSTCSTDWRTSPGLSEIWSICWLSTPKVRADLSHHWTVNEHIFRMVDLNKHLFHIQQFLWGNTTLNTCMLGGNGPNTVRSPNEVWHFETGHVSAHKLLSYVFQVSVLRLARCWSRPSVQASSTEQPSPSSSLRASSSSHLLSLWLSRCCHDSAPKCQHLSAQSDMILQCPRLQDWKMFVNVIIVPYVVIQKQDHGQNLFCKKRDYIQRLRVQCFMTSNKKYLVNLVLESFKKVY